MKKQIYILIALVAVFSFALISETEAAPGTLVSVAITPSNQFGTFLGNYTVAFTTASTTPSTAQIKLMFPAGFTIGDVATTTTLTGFDGILATSTAATSGTTQVVNLFRADGTSKGAATAVTLAVANIRSPSAGGSFTMDVETLYLEGDQIEIGTSAAFAIITCCRAPSLYSSETSDVSSPTSKIISPTDGLSILAGENYVIKGSGTDVGGSTIQSVEISLDGGKSWSRAQYSAVASSFSWEYVWKNPTAGEYVIQVRATDSKGNKESPSAGTKVTVAVPVSPAPIEEAEEVPEKPITEMTAQELRAKILEIQQQVVILLQQLIQLLQAQL